MENDSPYSQNPNAPDESINLRYYWHIVLERRWLVITAFISVFVLCLIYLFKATPIYEAVSRVEINPETENVLKLDGISVGGGQHQEYLQTQYKNLLSRALLDKVIHELRLDKDERYAESLDIPMALADDVTIAPIRLSRLVDVKAQHPDPKTAAKIANSLVDNFIKDHLDQKKKAIMDIVDMLGAEADAARLKLEEAERARQEYAAKHNQVSFEESENIVLQALKQYQGEHAAASSAAAVAETEVAQVEALLRAKADVFTIPQVAQNPNIQALQAQLAAFESAFAELRKKYREKHPDYIRAVAEIDALRNAMEEQAMVLIASIRNNAQIARAKEKKLHALVAEQEKRNLELNQLRIQYDVLKREAEQQAALHAAVVGKLKELDLSGRNKVNNIRAVYEAPTPIKPVKPRVVLTLFLGVVGGLGVAIGLAFFVNFLDDSIKTQDDVENHLRLPFLGYIPNIKTNSVVERDLQAHLHPQSSAAEGFRTVRATISLTHKPEKFQVLSITSTIPSEGKSLVASNLAIVSAQTGVRTLLVDADMRRPSVHKAYQLHSPNGLSAYLTEDLDDVSDIIHQTEVANLDVVCCGAVPSTPSELAGSKRMLEFIQAVRGRYDRVILDCPPISAVSDPLIIAAMSDGVVFVTKFNKIRREHARKSIQRIQNAGIHIMGVVLNDIDFEGKDSYYYSYYYYQNRYYSSHYRSVKPEMSTAGKSATPAELAKSRNGHG